MNSVPGDIIYLITQRLNYHDYVALMLCTKRFFALLNSDRFLYRISKRERLSIVDVRNGLGYLRFHLVYNYDQSMIPQPTYFRQYCDNLAVDIFDRLWIQENRQRMVKTQQRVVYAYSYTASAGRRSYPYDGYLVLTHKGTIIYYNWHKNIISRKRVGAIDLRVEGDYFVYLTKHGYRVADFVSDMSMDEFLMSHTLTTFLDHQGNLWLNKEIIVSNVKVFDAKKYGEDTVLYYLTYSGDLCTQHQQYSYRIQSDVRDGFFYGNRIYAITSNKEMHEFALTQGIRIESLARIPKRIEVGAYHKVLIEYER